MPVLILKAKADSPSELEKLMLQANQRVTGLLEGQRGRVLVVYERQAASIYYEGVRPPARPARGLVLKA